MVVFTLRRPAIGGLVLAVLAGLSGACEWPAGAPRRYHGSFIVLESPRHGPELCSSILESLPPQCSGLPVRNWEWAAVEGAESLSGTTWGRWHVTGTFDGEAFVLTEVPRAAERDHPDADETDRRLRPGVAKLEKALAAVQEDLRADEVKASLGTVRYSYTDSRRGVVVAAVWFAERSALQFAKERWGDLVELRPLLKPVG